MKGNRKEIGADIVNVRTGCVSHSDCPYFSVCSHTICIHNILSIIHSASSLSSNTHRIYTACPSMFLKYIVHLFNVVGVNKFYVVLKFINFISINVTNKINISWKVYHFNYVYTHKSFNFNFLVSLCYF